MKLLRWIWERIKHVFNGTKASHAKVDAAVKRAEAAVQQVEDFCSSHR